MPIDPAQIQQSSQGQQPNNQGKASSLIEDINQKLNQLGDIIDNSKLPPEDKQSYGDLMDSFYGFVENMNQPMGGNPQQQQQQRPIESGNVPIEAGNRNVQPAL